MIRRADSRPFSRLAAGLALGAGLGLGAACLPAGPAAAQALFWPSIGFAPLPSFAWPQMPEDAYGRWTGSYARLSTGYAVSTSRHFGSYSGPTIGFEGGRMWQEGPILYGISGGFDYLAGLGGTLTPGFGRLAYSNDFAGSLEVKVGTLVAPDVLVYAKTGALALHQTLRVGPTPGSLPFTRQDIAVRPVAGVGVEWAVTDRLSLAVEAGVVGGGIR
ncbi:outer membrane protein [Methylobacterium fujisawaense]|uniref:outer membrane protein n=1 Tax=Methylobacterium fujisawaense TaxID=107400 RepID=UPI003CEFEE25